MPRTLRDEQAEYYAASDSTERVEVEHKNPIRELGFAQIEHVITLDQKLSDGAYRTLGILHYFWQQKTSAYPSVETLAELRGVTVTTVSRHLAELTEKKLISRERRVGTSSITYLEDLPEEYHAAAAAILQKRRDNKNAKITKMSGQTLQKCNVEAIKNVTKRITIEEEQEEKQQQQEPPPVVVAAVSSVKKEKNPESSRKDEKVALTFQLYQQQIGVINPRLAELVREDIEDIPLEWIPLAFDRAAAANANKWAYVKGTLQNWKAQGGPQDRKNGNGLPAKQPKRYAESAVEYYKKTGESLQDCFERLKREGKFEPDGVMWVP